jgi:hypothetical protein
LKYRRTLILCYTACALLWIAWCLYWPFFARDQDFEQADTEAAKAYEVCLQQPRVTAQACRADRESYQKLLRDAAAPPGENVYQVFAGNQLGYAIAIMSALCLLPPLVVFGFLRLLLELALFLGRLVPKAVRVSR